ncbi:MAG: non-homologous end-joining DNA ligase [Actinomycetota bacterium]
MAPDSAVEVAVGDRTLRLTNLEKVLYPEAGFTKAQVIDYYVRIAPVMVPHIADRGITMRRYPDGVDAESFFAKRCPDWRPDWMEAVAGPGERRGKIDYCRLEETAALAWAANLAALEIHSPMARCDDIESPAMLVYDLDPGPGTTIVECCQIALVLRDLLATVALEAWPKTSGSKGMQLYVPLNTPHDHGHASSFAKASGQLLERDLPDRVTTVMARAQRTDKIFIDWSQNSRHKTTIAPYSLRARAQPTVSTPIGWDEVQAGADGASLSFTAADVLERVGDRGDLFADTLSVEQRLPLVGG